MTNEPMIDIVHVGSCEIPINARLRAAYAMEASLPKPLAVDLATSILRQGDVVGDSLRQSCKAIVDSNGGDRVSTRAMVRQLMQLPRETVSIASQRTA